jgi:hypothetical protein
MVLPPQQRWVDTGVYIPHHPWSGGEVEVGAAARSPDPPEVAPGARECQQQGLKGGGTRL